MTYCESCDEEWELCISHCGYCGKRLGPSRSGADTGYAGRAADKEPGAAEARSGERRRVTPVEAEALLEKWTKRACDLAEAGETRNEILCSEGGKYRAIAAEITIMAIDLATLIYGEPKPESEARSDLGASNENPVS